MLTLMTTHCWCNSVYFSNIWQRTTWIQSGGRQIFTYLSILTDCRYTLKLVVASNYTQTVHLNTIWEDRVASQTWTNTSYSVKHTDRHIHQALWQMSEVSASCLTHRRRSSHTETHRLYASHLQTYYQIKHISTTQNQNFTITIVTITAAQIIVQTCLVFVLPAHRVVHSRLFTVNMLHRLFTYLLT